MERLSATGSDRVNPCGHSPALCSLPSLWSFWSHLPQATRPAPGAIIPGSVGETMVGARRAGRRLRPPRLTLASQILTLQLVIIFGALIVGIFASWWVTRQRLDDEYGHRALVIAQSVAAVPAVSEALTGAGPVPAVQPLAESI